MTLNELPEHDRKIAEQMIDDFNKNKDNSKINCLIPLNPDNPLNTYRIVLKNGEYDFIPSVTPNE